MNSILYQNKKHKDKTDKGVPMVLTLTVLSDISFALPLCFFLCYQDFMERGKVLTTKLLS